MSRRHIHGSWVISIVFYGLLPFFNYDSRMLIPPAKGPVKACRAQHHQVTTKWQEHLSLLLQTLDHNKDRDNLVEEGFQELGQGVYEQIGKGQEAGWWE